jgi:hypothetical protein
MDAQPWIRSVRAERSGPDRAAEVIRKRRVPLGDLCLGVLDCSRDADPRPLGGADVARRLALEELGHGNSMTGLAEEPRQVAEALGVFQADELPLIDDRPELAFAAKHTAFFDRLRARVLAV